jgi:hypothetical protein
MFVRNKFVANMVVGPLRYSVERIGGVGPWASA